MKTPEQELQELHELRLLIAPMGNETAASALKKRLKYAKRIEDSTESILRAMVALWDHPVIGIEFVGILQGAGVYDKNRKARIDHPLFYLLPKKEQERALRHDNRTEESAVVVP